MIFMENGTIPYLRDQFCNTYTFTGPKVRYNRLIDIFLGITTYSLQNHMRTTVAGLGQIEIDEIYVGIDKQGRQYVVPVQAKGGKDKHGLVQTLQDVMCCEERFPHLICRPVSAQFMKEGRIALFELTFEDGEMKIVDERVTVN